MTTHTRQQLLLVEDDLPLAEWICDYLQSKGFEMQHCQRGDEAVALIIEQQPDLVILDGMLPGLDGLDVCREVRSKYDKPIIMLTARDGELDEVLGFEIGADDYLIKPVRARALLARIRALLRKHSKLAVQANHKDVESDKLEFNQLVIDRKVQEVRLKDEPLNISTNEFEVLWMLAKKAGEVVSRNNLVSELRGFEYDGFDRSIDLRISRLRKKLGDDPENPYRIKTIWGKGYLFVADAW